MLFLYDPRTNVSRETSNKELMGITENSISTLSKAKIHGRKLRAINCYITDGVAPLKKRQEWYAKESYPDETWLQVNGTKNNYLVSNYGRVKRVYKSVERFMLPYQRKGEGNLFVKIDGNEIKVGHLVADAFLRKRLPHESVIRKNGIVTDDHAANLRIISKAELGRRTGYKSKSMPVVQIDARTGEIVNEYRSAREAARNYFMSYQAILNRCNGVHSQSDGYIWKFARDVVSKDINAREKLKLG